MSIQYLDRKNAVSTVKREIIPTDVVLDIGCGIRPQNYFRPRTHICVEPYSPYIEKLRKDAGCNSNYVILNCSGHFAMSLLPPKSIDTVFILDVIEHLPKHEGFDLIKEAERLARKQIVIFTPLGFMPQPYNLGETDRWGMDGGYFQTHRSGWEPKDFGDGWQFIACKEFHRENKDGPLDQPFGAFWAIRTFDGATKGNGATKSKRKGPRFNLGVARNMFLRSLFLMNIYNVGMVAYMFIKQADASRLHWYFILAFFSFPIWWLLDFFVIWRQEADANFKASKVWAQHEEKTDEILSRLEGQKQNA